MLWVTAFSLLAKSAGAIKEVVVAARYGVGPVIDAYGLAFTAMMLPVGLCASVLLAAVVPAEARWARERPSVLPRFRDELWSCTLGLAVVVALLLSVILPRLGGAAPSVDPSLLAQMSRPLAMASGLGVLGSLYSAWVMSQGSHLNTLLDGTASLVLALLLLLVPTHTPALLAWSTMIGYLAHLLLLAWAHHRRCGPVRPRWNMESPVWAGFVGAMGALLAGQVMAALTGLTEPLIAGRLGQGAISVLGYASRTLALFSGLAGLIIGRAMLPVFSALHQREPQDLRREVRRWVMRAGGLGVALCLVLALGAEGLVALLFERGQFSAEHTVAVARALQAAALQLPLLLPMLVLTTYAAASHRHRLLAWTGLQTLLVVPLAGWFAGAAWGVPGLMVAPALGQALAIGLLTAALLRHGQLRGQT